MSLSLIVPPAALPVTLAEVKDHLRFIDGDLDALIAGYIHTATARLDGADGVLGRALIRQTWRLDLACFPAVIELPLPPLAEVLSVTYVDPAGAQQTLDPADYIVADVGSDGSIRPAIGKSFPATRAVPAAVQVTFVAGADDWNGVPEPLRAAIAVHVAHLFDNRDDPALPTGYMELITPFKAYWTV